jgi:ribonuclease R
MPDEMPERILSYVGRPEYRPQPERSLARSMGIARGEYGEFRQAVKELMAAGRIVLGSTSAIMLPEAPGELVGTFRAHARGFGFVVPSSETAHGDLYIPEGESLDAITGDTVRARVIRRGKRRGEMLYHGRIVEVVERGASRFVGELRRDQGRWCVWPDGNALHVPVFVDDVGAKGAKAGDQVVVEIITYPGPGKRAHGVIVERLGRRGERGVDVRSILRQYHIPEGHPAEALADARHVTRSFDLERELARREDLRNQTIITIDPTDARDFDDAISLRRLAHGEWELGVHIADVSAFVREGSSLDAEARLRGNSVYLPQYVVPMLPEVLSNGLCSLQQDEPRLTKSAFIRYDKDGRVLASRFANTVICSRARLTYDQATLILEGKTGGFDKRVVELLSQMERLARVIQRRRLDEGMIVLDLPEIELELDEDGRVVDAHPADTSFSHTLIEMFMVEANEAVARLLDRLNVPFLRRIHPEPPSDSSTNVSRFVRVFGHQIKGPLDRKAMIRLLNTVRGRPEAFAVNMAVLRSMEQAVYSPRNVGHFALASRYYCHFTSPIRRYPDLTVHRLLDRYLAGRLEKGTHPAAAGVPDFNALVQLGEHCSFTERRAADAEREARTVKVLELLSDRIDETFDGVVTGVANVGVFVRSIRYGVEGLIRFGDLPDDWWDLDPRTGSAVGQRTGRRISLGDPVAVRIVSVNIPARQMDLALAEQPRKAPAKTPEPAGKAPHKKGAQKSKKHAGGGRPRKGRHG